MSYSCRILAIDGGGIRGIIPAYVLKELEAALGRQTYQSFDIVAGTSTGGIISLALTTPKPFLDPPAGPPYTAEQVLSFYLEDEAELFVKQSSGDGFEAKYWGTKPGDPPTGIQPWLQAHFPRGMTLADARTALQAMGQAPRQVLTTCYTIAGASSVEYGPYLFNWEAAAASQADDYFVWEAARATSAAPTYFPIAQIGQGAPGGSGATMRWAVDGGLAANDPAVFALAEASRLGLFGSLDEVLLVSLGTGLYNAGVQVNDDGNWGLIQWTAGIDNNGHPTEPLISVLAMANQQVPDAQLGRLLPGTGYYRLEPSIPYSESTMDGGDTQALLETAKSYIAPGGDGYAKFQAVKNALSA